MLTQKEIAIVFAEGHAHLAEAYRGALSHYPGVENTYKRYVIRECMVEMQNRCAEIMAQLAAQGAR